jgi:hypothetical protein
MIGIPTHALSRSAKTIGLGFGQASASHSCCTENRASNDATRMGNPGNRELYGRLRAHDAGMRQLATRLGHRLPSVFRFASLAKVVPLWCALLIGLALPVVRMIHEDTHHHHPAVISLDPPLPHLSSRDGDDDEGTCSLCQLLAAAAGQHAVVHDVAAILLPCGSIEIQSLPALAADWIPNAAQQPPARGPPGPLPA